MTLIAHIGKPGSFSHLAARAQYGIDHTHLGCSSFADVFKIVSEGDAEIGVVPVENSLSGSLYENYDLFNTYPLSICAEQYLKVEHFLLARKSEGSGEERLKQIKIVYSHPKALEQCKEFFSAHPWMKPTIANDTATAAAQVAGSNDVSLAAIGSEDSAHLYRLAVYARNIEDDTYNYTRFIYIHKSTARIDQANKCSLQLELAHKPGSLVSMLQVISSHSLNLTKIESRPIHGKPFEYKFYIDFEFTQKQVDGIENILSEIKRCCDRMKVLGVYKAGIINV